MQREQWLKVKNLAKTILSVPPTERETWLVVACGGDQDLIEAVYRSLGHHEDHTQAVTKLQVSAQPMTGELAGLVFRSWRLLREIGSGGMGSVWLAERADSEFKMMAAVKVIKRERADLELIGRFKRERQILADLRHSNISALLDGGTTADGMPYLVMEYVDGLDIAKYCFRNKLDTRRRVDLVIQIGKAVAYAHSKGILHRDIKPGNILVNNDGTPKLLDFGIAGYETEEYSDLTLGRLVPMTPDYSSPERRKGQRVSEADDVYALGLVLFYLLTARHPRTVGGHWESVLNATVEDYPNDPLLRSLAQILTRLLGRPEWRTSTAAAFSSELEHARDLAMTTPYIGSKSSSGSGLHFNALPQSIEEEDTQTLHTLAQSTVAATTGSQTEVSEEQDFTAYLQESDALAKHGLLDLAWDLLLKAKRQAPLDIEVNTRLKSLYQRRGNQAGVVGCLISLIEESLNLGELEDATGYVSELQSLDPTLASQQLLVLEAALQKLRDRSEDMFSSGKFPAIFEDTGQSEDPEDGLSLSPSNPELEVLDLRSVKIYETYAREMGCPTFSEEWSLEFGASEAGTEDSRSDDQPQRELGEFLEKHDFELDGNLKIKTSEFRVISKDSKES